MHLKMLSACSSVRIPICLSSSLSFCPYVRPLFGHLSIHPSIHQSACLFLQTYICQFVYPYVCHSVHPLAYLDVCLSVCFSIPLVTHFSV
jgi:hypothetical protein